MKKSIYIIIILSALLVTPLWTAWGQSSQLPQGFVYLERIIPDIEIELRYLTTNNFVGKPIDGYVRPRCILTQEAAMALKKVQNELRTFGLCLKIFDAYRPQMAVDHFIRWAKDLSDIKMKSTYYPDVDKKDLFRKGYIASQSGHTRGSSVDLTLVAKNPSGSVKELNMGTPFDMFDSRSWVKNQSVAPAQRAHRMLLQTVMKQHGFKPYHREWWHFTLVNEPFPETYFNFKVE